MLTKKNSLMDDNRSEGDHLMQINAGEEIVDNDEITGNLSQADSEEWNRVRPRRKKHIELRDLTEQNFVDLIASKNQDKRFFGWLNFKPLFDEYEEEHKSDFDWNENLKQNNTQVQE